MRNRFADGDGRMSDEPNCEDTEFGALLRQYRGRRGLTQAELAERSGLNVQAVSMLERGVRREPRSTTVAFLAQALKLDAQQWTFAVLAVETAPCGSYSGLQPPAAARRRSWPFASSF